MSNNYEKDRECICPYCNKKFIISGKKLICRIQAENRGTVVNGPFCSKKCLTKFFQEYRGRPEYRYEKLLDEYFYEEIYNENVEFLLKIINRDGYVSGIFI